MDLKKLNSVAACEKPVSVAIRDANDQSTDIVIQVVGVDSATYRTANAAGNVHISRIQKRLDQLKTRLEKVTRGSKEEKELEANITKASDEIEAEYCKIMARCTVGWSGLEENGSAVEFSQETAELLYMSYPLLKSQVFVALFDRASFLGNL